MTRVKEVIKQSVWKPNCLCALTSCVCLVHSNCSTEWKWLVDRARVGSRWTWLPSPDFRARIQNPTTNRCSQADSCLQGIVCSSV